MQRELGRLETIWNKVGILCEAQAERPGADTDNVGSQLGAGRVLPL